MGMDVYGTNPTSDKGIYFRANVWWWRPIAEYCVRIHPDIAEHCEHWDSNDGDGLDAEMSSALATRLHDDIASGQMAKFEYHFNKWRSELPRENCEFCNATGIRTDKVGLENGMHDRELDPEVQILTGRTHGWCNACNGVGTREHFDASYPFTVEFMKEFADFLQDCGGFSIC